MRQPAWEAIGLGAAGPPAAPTRAVRRTGLPPWEEAITFVLLLVALLAVVISVERADWVREMPSLGVAALFGLVSGWALARVRAHAAVLHLAGLAFGLAVVFGMVMHTMRLGDPSASGVRARWSELWARNGDWVQALRTGDASTDPLPFVLLVVLMSWALAYIAAWAVVRWRNAWLALVPGGFALLTNISYLPGQPSVEFIVFLFAAILLFTRLHMLRVVEDAEGDGPATSPLLSLEVLNLTTWVGLGLIALAWLVPTANNWGPVAGVWERALSPIDDRIERVGRLFVGVGSKRDRGLHDFGSVLPLQGSVTLGRETLFEVQAPEPLYLRGAVYDEYTGTGWKLTDASKRPVGGLTVDAAQLGTPLMRTQFRRPVPAQVKAVDPVGRKRLFAIGEPLTTDAGAQLLTSNAAEDLLGLVPANEVDKGDEYTSVGSVSGAGVDRLVTASVDYPAWVRERYLQLPDSLPPEVRDLARDIAGNSRVPYVTATRVEQYLRQNYPYTLNAGERPPRRDAVAYFLFEARRGYFDFHASAMAVLLRSVGVPARVAVGFALDESDRDVNTKAFAVSERRSWTWTEVFFPGYGWVEFNPTPGLPSIVRAGQDDPAVTPTPEPAVADPSGVDPGANDELLMQQDPGLSDEDLDQAGADGGSPLGRLFTLVFLGAVLLLAALAAAMVAWHRAFAHLAPASRRWAKLQLLAGWAGVHAGPSQTPLETATALSASLRPRLDVTPLAVAYVRERYGRGAMLDPEDLAHEQLYTRARGRLWKRILRRTFGLERGAPQLLPAPLPVVGVRGAAARPE